MDDDSDEADDDDDCEIDSDLASVESRSVTDDDQYDFVDEGGGDSITTYWDTCFVPLVPLKSITLHTQKFIGTNFCHFCYWVILKNS